MLTFLYYVTMFYFSIFCLTILDKINKGEIKTKADLKSFLLGRSIIVLSNYHKIKRLTNDTYHKCIKYKQGYDSEEEENEEENNLLIFTQDKRLRLSVIVQEDKIRLKCEYPLEKEFKNEILYIENDGFLKELKDYKLRDFYLDNDNSKLDEDILTFLNGELLTDNKLFINVELVNGKLRNSESYDITNAIQKYFVEKNIILSKSFLEKILRFGFNITLSDDYSLNIMTKNVEMIQITNVQKINLIRTEDNVLSYEILENKKE